ncbi:MAG: pyruvate formate lyase family protein, partial [Mycoplasmatota bacterium]
MINVSKFIEENYTEYLGDESFLQPITNKTKAIWEKCEELLKEELKKGVLDVELTKVSGINSFEAGYIDKENEVIFGLQTDKPLKRIVNPFGGVRMAKQAAASYGYNTDELLKTFKGVKTHNDGVFEAYTKDILKARKNGLITGLPDAYGRGRIIGDYRRIALYGIDYLIEEKQKDLEPLVLIDEESIRLRQEIAMQIKALKEVNEMALKYGIDMSKKAESAFEAVQFTYFGYLAGTKENNGAATSLGRVSTFLDIYLEKDILEGKITEVEAQELIDQFVIKLRLIRHLRTPEYNELFAGDPTWVTESIGGMLNEKNSLVTKTSYRFLHTLTNLGSAPEPNMTVLWSNNLPDNFKKYCAKMSILTDALQY